MRRSTQAVGVLCSDIHLCHKPPIARSAEEDWYQTQAGYLIQLRGLVEQHDVPLVIAGDIFDKWDSPAELINFAIRYLPKCFAVPGQHDLPNHRYEDIKRSAYWTLCEAGVITNLPPEEGIGVGGLRLWGFPWGYDVAPPMVNKPNPWMEVAVIHSYVWIKGKGYPGAPQDKRGRKFSRLVLGCDVALTGDNHIPFEYKNIFNSGGFMRRKANEKDALAPSVGVLYSDGRVDRYYLNVSEDAFLEVEEIAEAIEGIGFETLVEALSDLGDSAIDFTVAINRLMQREKVDDRVKAIIDGWIKR